MELKSMILSKLAQKNQISPEDKYNIEKVDLYLERRKADLYKILERPDISNDQIKIKF